MKMAGILVFLLIFTGACTQSEDTEPKNVGLVNPASVYCEDNGGTLEIVDTPEGQSGECHKGNSTCEEWKYYRGECKFD